MLGWLGRWLGLLSRFIDGFMRGDGREMCERRLCAEERRWMRYVRK
jgi:hypothetical protein